MISGTFQNERATAQTSMEIPDSCGITRDATVNNTITENKHFRAAPSKLCGRIMTSLIKQKHSQSKVHEALKNSSRSTKSLHSRC